MAGALLLYISIINSPFHSSICVTFVGAKLHFVFVENLILYIYNQNIERLSIRIRSDADAQNGEPRHKSHS